MLRARTASRLAFGVALALASTGCIGSIGDGEGPGSNGNGDTEGLDVASAPIGRMTPAQYENSVRDLLGDPELDIDLDEDLGEAFSRLGAEKLNRAVEEVAEREAYWQAPVFPCDVSGEEDAACVDAFIESFGYRAFRRPLFDEEVAWLKSVYAEARTQQSFHDAMIVVLQVILQSPQFVYFLELGTEPQEGLPEGVLPLSGFERATRLSYFLLDSIPDAELLEAAERGDLDTTEGVKLHAERLMETPRARALVRGFFTHLLELDGTTKHASLDDVMRDPALFPEDSPELRTAMRAEVDALVDRLVFEEKKSVRELFTSNQAYVDASLASLYDVAPPGNGSTWVTLPAERGGLLTRAAFLTLYSRGDVKSPIRRGAFIVEHLLCLELGEPPPNANDVPITGGTVDENGETVRRTIRQDVEAKTSGEGCSGCHQLINPVGFTFDNFDALGRYVTEEVGSDDDGDYTLPIDVSGGLPNVDAEGGLNGSTPVTGAAAMSAAIAASPALSRCMADKWFGAAVRRKPEAEDARSIERITEALTADRPLVEVVVEAATSDAFLYLRKESN